MRHIVSQLIPCTKIFIRHYDPVVSIIADAAESVRPNSAMEIIRPADATIKTLAATIKARWVCEQAHQQLKEELGLDHFEGRSWTGLHRHALMTMIAYAFLQSRRLKAAGRKKKNLRTATTTKHAGHQASDPRPLRTTSTPTMSSL